MGNYLAGYMGRMYISREDSDWDIASHSNITVPKTAITEDRKPSNMSAEMRLNAQQNTTVAEQSDNPSTRQDTEAGSLGAQVVPPTGQVSSHKRSHPETIGQNQKIRCQRMPSGSEESHSTNRTTRVHRLSATLSDDDDDRSSDIDKFATFCHQKSDGPSTECHLSFKFEEKLPKELVCIKEGSSDAPNIDSLPSHILVDVFARLSIYDLLHNVCLVSRYWYDLAHDPDLWRSICLKGQLKVDDTVLQRVVSHSESVYSIDISDARNVSEHGIEALAKQCTGLNQLKMMRCVQLKEAAFIALGNHCPNLTVLHLDCCFCLGDRAIATISAGCPRMRVLHINQCGILSNEGLQAVGAGFPDLEDLSMDQCKQIGDPGLLAVIEGCPKLKRLSAMSCVFTSQGVIQLTRLRNLERLELHDVLGVSDDCIIEVVRYCRKLHTLNLSLCTRITDRGVDFIARNTPNLRALYIASCDITNKALTSLGTHSRTVENVDVGWCNNVTDEGAVSISETCGTLRSLGLTRCDKVTIQTMDYLVEKYPHIHYSTFWLDCRRLMSRAQKMGYAPASQFANNPAAIGHFPAGSRRISDNL